MQPITIPADLVELEARMTGNNGTSASFRMPDLKALVAEAERSERERDKRVFCFKGTLAEFLAELRKAGFKDAPPNSGIPYHLTPLGSLAFVERNGMVFIGDQRDLNRALGAANRGEADGDVVVTEWRHDG